MIFQKIRGSLLAKLILGSVIIEVIMLFLLLNNSVRLVNQATLEYAKTHLKEIPPLLNSALAPLLFQRDYAAINDFLNDIMIDENSGITYIIIYDNAGQIYGKKGNVDTENLPEKNDILNDKIQTEFINSEIPLILSTRKIGVVKFGISLAHQIESKNKLLNQGILIASGEIILTILLLGLLGFILTRHIAKFVTSANAMSEGNYKVEIQNVGTDEIGQLSKSFNTMASAIQEQVENLKKSEEKYRQLVELAQEGIWTIDKDNNTKFVNSSMAKMLGYTPEEMLSKSLFDFMDKQGVLISKANIERRKKGIRDQHDFEFIHQKGYRIFTTMATAPMLDDTGEYDGAIAGVIDISRRKESEDKLKISQNRFTLAMEASRDGLFDWNLVTNEIYYSPGWKRMLGYNDNEIPNDFSVWEKLTAPEDIERSWKMQNELINKEQDRFEMEFQMKHKNGQWIEILSRAKAIFDTNGKAIRMVGTHVDITDRKLEEKRYRKTVESSIDGYWMADTKGNFLEVNEAYSSMIGYRRGELLKMSIMDVEALEHPEETKKRIEKIIRNGSSRFESKHRHKKGQIIDVEVSATYTPDSGGLFFVFLRNITYRNRMEEQLKQAQKMESIGTLAGGIAHDFNNILFPIVGHAEMLIEDVPEDSPLRDGLDEIYASALRAKDLVKQILTFSRQENSEFKLMKMQPIIKEALKLIRSTIPATIDIKQDIETGCGIIKADPTQIHQIIMNLTTNAYHAMENTGGELMVGLKEIQLKEHDLISPDLLPGIYACLSISDTGVGIEKALIDKIFDPFFTTKEKGKGTGMGLSVVHGIIKRMGGAIHVYSEPGKGTEFNTYFPIEKSSLEKPTIQTKEPIQGGTEQVLLVDDEKAILKMEKRMLERLGYQVTSRTSSIEALETFSANPDKFDLVITDMAMPNMSGDKLSAKLTKIRLSIPVLLCTGFSETMSEEKAVSQGIKGFLLKPIVMNDLSQKIREVLDENKK